MIQVAFLRAVNVAGHASVKMTDLQRAFESAGCTSVRTYIQSGNVLFQSAGAGSKALRLKIGKSVGRLLGQEVVVAYRGLRELKAALAAAPFGPLASDPEVKLYVGFLVDKPKKVPALPVSWPKEGLEVVGLARQDVFVVSRKVKGRYGFPNSFLEREFGVPATTRNWNTVAKIVALAQER